MVQKAHLIKTTQLLCSAIQSHHFQKWPHTSLKQIPPDKIITDSVEQANIYNYQKKQKNTKVAEVELKSLIGIMIKMGIVSLPYHKCYSTQEIHYYSVTDVMLRNRFQSKKTCTLPITMK